VEELRDGMGSKLGCVALQLGVQRAKALFKSVYFLRLSGFGIKPAQNFLQ
jgi:hypothetical protein